MNVTYRCNARCKWCHCGCDLLDGTGTDLSLADVERFCDSLEGTPVKSFRIAGGEPTLLPYLEEACRIIASRVDLSNCRNPPHVSTNGLLPRPPLPAGWRYRVDGAGVKVHDPVWWSPADLGIDPGGYVCTMPRFCGRTFDYRGWTFCQIATQLGRVLGIDARTDGPESPSVGAICRHCWYSVPEQVRRDVCDKIRAGRMRSPTSTWEAALATAPKRT